jgi:UDP-N-acetylglucosamine:LPS N-acetylglucosamine transferase
VRRRHQRDKVVLVASSGGHLLQLVQLRDEWPRDRRHWITFDKPDAISLLAEEDVTFAYHPTNRNVRNFLRNVVLAFRVLRRLRPAAVVTTGAGVAVPFCWIGKVLGARIIFIESFSRITEPSLTARLVHPVADEFFVQWPELQSRFTKAKYEGALF